MALLNDKEQLGELHEMLEILGNEIDDGILVPGRYERTAKSLIAEYEAKIIRTANEVVHRLMIRATYPSVSQETDYVNRIDTREENQVG